MISTGAAQQRELKRVKKTRGRYCMKRRRIRLIAVIVLVLIAGLTIVIRGLPGNRMKRLIKQGNDLLLEKEYEEAASVLTRALEIDGRNAAAYFARGDAYAGMGETQKARLDYIRAEELNANMTGAVEQKLSEMNAIDAGIPLDESVSDAAASEETDSPDDSDISPGSSDEEVIPAEEITGEVVFNQEAMNAASYAGDPSTFPSQTEMILADVDVYNTFQASSENSTEAVSGPLTIYYDKNDGHIACIMAPAGTYLDHANEFEHTLNAQYYYRLKDDGRVEPAFIYLSDDEHTEVHMIYMWEGRVIRYVGPVDSSDYQQDYEPALTIEEFAGQVPQGVFAANACLELQWMGAK